MRILLITNYFPPEIGAASHLYYELACGLVRNGHRVTVLTGTPRYNISDLERSRRAVKVVDEQVPFEVIRVRLPQVPRGSKVRRGLEHFEVAWKLARTRVPECDAVLLYSPPLTMGFTGLAVRRRTGAKIILNVQDLFPKELVDTGLIRNRLIIRCFELMESYLYRHVDGITVHSAGNATHVLQVSGRPHGVWVVPNWVNTDEIVPEERDNDFRGTHGYGPGDFVVSFAGTLGHFQDSGVILDAASCLKSDPNIRFLVVGDGPEKPGMMDRAGNEGLTNVAFLPTQARDIYPRVLAASDVCLVTLTRSLATPVVPSKLLSIMAAGRPVVAAVPDTSDSIGIIEEAGCGLRVDSGDGVGLAEAIGYLKANKDLARDMGTAGRRFVLERFSVKAAVHAYEDVFRELVAQAGASTALKAPSFE